MNRQAILDRIKNNAFKLQTLGVAKIGLFGSYLRNEQTDQSDIDLLVDFEPEKETFDNFMSICDLLESIFQGKKVGIVTKNGLSEYIGKYILNEVEYA